MTDTPNKIGVTAKGPGISTTEALEIARARGYKITLPTLIKWLGKYGIGKKVFGRWYVDEDKFLYFLRYGNHGE